MKATITVVCMLACMIAGSAGAAEKHKSASRIEVARSAIETLAAKADANKLVADNLQIARSYFGKAEAAYEKSREFLGLLNIGDKKAAAEQDISHYTTMVDFTVTLANSRLEKYRIEGELAGLNKQVAAVRTKVKVFDDLRAEIEKLRAEVAKHDGVSRELVATKADKAVLVSQVELLMAERGQSDKIKLEKGELIRKLDEQKAENTRLMEQVEKLAGERKALSAQLEEVRKGALMRELAETPVPAKETAPVVETPPVKVVAPDPKVEQPALKVTPVSEPPQATPAEK